MSMQGLPEPELSSELLETLLAQPMDVAAQTVQSAVPDPVVAVRALSQAALDAAEERPEAARHWLAVGARLGEDAPASRAWVAYARARLLLASGEMAAAEASLRQAQAGWEEAGDTAMLTRSRLGLTQLLAMQGRYTEADAAIGTAIGALETRLAALDPADLDAVEWHRQLVGAQRNRAALLGTQARHQEALEAFDQAADALEAAAQALPAAELSRELAHLALNRAVDLMYLDRLQAAESALLDAASRFSALDERVNNARARSNLGSLYLRTGRYDQALARFDEAWQGFAPALAESDGYQPGLDLFMLDRVGAYLALNLLAEAEDALARAVDLFRRLELPLELGQALYTQGLLRLRTGRPAEARALLDEAMERFTVLENRYWANRTQVALAQVEAATGDLPAALERLQILLAAREAAADEMSDDSPTGSAGLFWDLDGEMQARLLQLDLLLRDVAPHEPDLARVRVLAGQVDARLAAATEGVEEAALPQWRLRMAYLRGRIAQEEGDQKLARTHFQAALSLLEAQRASLSLEEVRTAYLADKTELYAALVLSLLDEPAPPAATVAQAFDVIERARSRALLERLLQTMEGVEAAPGDPVGEDLAARRAEIRRQLHWLYNRLLGDEGTRHLAGATGLEIRAQESLLEQLGRQSAPLLEQAQPVDLATLQAVLDEDRQALVYFTAGDEIMAMVVDDREVRLRRRLCTPAAIQEALVDYRFQLGRAEMGADYVARHGERLRQGLNRALERLHRLLIAPLEDDLVRPRLLVIPHGDLHQLPFHALWDGACYLLERFEITYAPSASIAVHCRRRAAGAGYGSLAGLAIPDPTIPHAHAEVKAAARHFAHSTLYLDDRATVANLALAAAQADVLHVATHGLFRTDNPFFSALKLSDGWLDVRSIYRLPVAARLVVLSACESGAGEIVGGDEVVGLARGFLGAGVGELVVSLWNVHDASAARLMDTFYTHLATLNEKGGAAAALRSVQQAAIEHEEHPYYWAPFFVIG